MAPAFSHRTLQALYEAAWAVARGQSRPDVLRGPLQEIDEMIQFRESPQGQQTLSEARDTYQQFDSPGEIAIDDATMLYHNETDGYWVMGWCFVDDPDEDEDHEPAVPQAVVVSGPSAGGE